MPVKCEEDKPAEAVDRSAQDAEATGDINHTAGPSNVIVVTNVTRCVLTNPADIELLRSAFEDADVVEEMQPYPDQGRVRHTFKPPSLPHIPYPSFSTPYDISC